MSRDEEFRSLYASGKTLSEIGAIYKISRQRVHQITSQLGLSRHDGGMSVRATKRNLTREEKKEKRCMNMYGCSRLVFREIPKLIRLRFYKQKHNAKLRHVEWKLNLWQWYSIWLQSGKLHLRGRTKGHYVMARDKDQGAYAVGNVHVVTCSENIASYYEFYGDEHRNRVAAGKAAAKAAA